MEIQLKLNEEIDNKDLLDKFNKFFENQNDENHTAIVDTINKSKFVMPIMAKPVDIIEVDGEMQLSKKANVNFIGCLNENKEGFMPLFTSIEELDKFIEVMKIEFNDELVLARLSVPADMAWGMLLNDNGVCGAVIDALTIGWTIRTEQLVSDEE